MANPFKLLRSASAAGIACAAFGFLAVPAMAQDTNPDPDDDEIVVEGVLEVDGVGSRRQARDITQRLGSTSEPLARWQRPICAGVWGLTEENASLVINRIYDVAEIAGLMVDSTEACPANVWVIVVDDPAATFESLRDDNNWMVRGLGRSERNRVERQTGAARAWNIASYRDENGNAVRTGFDAVGDNQLAQQTGGNAGGAPIVQSSAMSRLRTAVRLDIDMSVVLIQRSAIGEFDAITIGDYAAMRALARTQEPSREGPYGTILTIFEDDLSPHRITAFDRAYLRSLNQGSAHRPGTRAMASFDELMEEELLREAGQLLNE